MSLHLIVDGYNLIRQSPALRVIEARDLEAGRAALLQRLAAYRRTRPQHKITVVFDGWQAGGPTESRDRYQGMGIIYSRRGERADEVIKRLLTQERGRAVVVSSDRELRDFADRVGATWITAPDFEAAHLPGHPDNFPPEADATEASHTSGKKGPSRRLPKRQRQRQQRLRKL